MFKYKELKEQEEKQPEEIPTGGGGGREKIRYNLILTPTNSSIHNVLKALDNINNYGIYMSNVRNTNVSLAKAIEDHFGPSTPVKKKSLEKQMGKSFPIKTKQAMDDFAKEFSKNSNKVKLLNYKVGPGGIVVFPYDKNPQKEVTKKMIDTVMEKAGIKYELKDKESIDEIGLGGGSMEDMGQYNPYEDFLKKLKNDLRNDLKKFKEAGGGGIDGYSGIANPYLVMYIKSLLQRYFKLQKESKMGKSELKKLVKEVLNKNGYNKTINDAGYIKSNKD